MTRTEYTLYESVGMDTRKMCVSAVSIFLSVIPAFQDSVTFSVTLLLLCISNVDLFWDWANSIKLADALRRACFFEIVISFVLFILSICNLFVEAHFIFGGAYCVAVKVVCCVLISSPVVLFYADRTINLRKAADRIYEEEGVHNGV